MDIVAPILDLVLTAALVACMVIQVRIMGKQKDIMNEQSTSSQQQTCIMREQNRISGVQTTIMDGQKSISDAQTNVMDGQKKLTQQIDISNKTMKMLEEYTDLTEHRDVFWDCISFFYRVRFWQYLDSQDTKLPEKVYVFIKEYGNFPDSYDPDNVNDLLEFIQDLDRERYASTYWGFIGQFACFIYQTPDIPQAATSYITNDTYASELKKLSEAHRQIAYFWDKWSTILDPSVALHPDPLELIMLTWLEFAQVLAVDDQSGRPGKTHLFKIARDCWKNFEART